MKIIGNFWMLAALWLVFAIYCVIINELVLGFACINCAFAWSGVELLKGKS